MKKFRTILGVLILAGLAVPLAAQQAIAPTAPEIAARAVETALDAERPAAAATRFSLILTDEETGGGTVYTVLTGHLEKGKLVQDSRQVVYKGASSPAREIAAPFAAGVLPYTRPMLPSVLTGVRGEPIRSLVFSGGGIKGLAYAGAVKTLEEADLMKGVTHFAGASAGAISAALLASGYTADRLTDAMMNKEFAAFLDEPAGINIPELMDQIKKGTFDWKDVWNYVKLAGLVGDVHFYYGICKGEAFETWFGEMISKQGVPADVTFSQLQMAKGKDLNVVLCDASRGRGGGGWVLWV